MSPHVHIYSFGYHRSGIPEDPYGNGGGFVFDCRALPNPGRDPAMFPLSGLDEEVTLELEQYPEVREFLRKAFELIDTTIQLYEVRGFEHLHVSFGCTGGQHRSVYCARRLAEHLKRNGIRASVTHTEQGIWW